MANIWTCKIFCLRRKISSISESDGGMDYSLSRSSLSWIWSSLISSGIWSPLTIMVDWPTTLPCPKLGQEVSDISSTKCLLKNSSIWKVKYYPPLHCLSPAGPAHHALRFLKIHFKRPWCCTGTQPVSQIYWWPTHIHQQFYNANKHLSSYIFIFSSCITFSCLCWLITSTTSLLSSIPPPIRVATGS